MSWITEFEPSVKRSREYEGNLGGQSWDYWTKDYNYYTPGKNGQRRQNTLPAELDRLKDADPKRYEVLNTNVFRWGKMPVEYAMNELGFDELNFDDTDQLEELNVWMEENFPDIFQQNEVVEEEEKESKYEPKQWEPKELSIDNYEPTPIKELQTSTMRIADARPRGAANSMQIKGIKGWNTNGN